MVITKVVKESKDLAEYKKQLKQNLKHIAPIFVKASVGDFSENVILPKKEDELSVFLVGIQIILDAVREKNKEAQDRLRDLNVVNKELTEDKAIYQSILNSIAEGLVVVDNNARITLINEPGATLLGLNPREVIGKKYYDLVVTKDKNNIDIPIENRPLHKSLTEGKQFITSILDGYQYVHSSGSLLQVAITASPVKIDLKIIGAVSTFRDVTEEISLDRSKSEIISIASHQLRTPLTAIKWLTDQLISPFPKLTSLKQRRKLRQIHDSNDRMISLVNDLLNVSRIDLGKLTIHAEIFNLSSVITDVISDLSTQIKTKKLKVTKEIDTKLHTIYTDPRHIQVAIQNIISNAVKYSYNKKPIKISAKTANSVVEIKVVDKGCGIPKTQQDNVFDKLFRADNARVMASDGSGLGLYVAKAMVEQLGGRIWFESEENKGSTFYISIPINQKP